MADKLLIEAGDILSFNSPKWLGKTIRWLTRGYDEKPSLASHNGLFIGDGPIEGVEIVESLVPSGVTRRSFFEAYKDELEFCTLLKPLNLTRGEREDICLWALEKVGKRYGYMTIIRQMEDGLLAKILRKKDIVFFRKDFFTIPGEEICSQFVAEAYKAGSGHDFGIKARYINPDEIRDFAEDHPEIYRLLSFPPLDKGSLPG